MDGSQFQEFGWIALDPAVADADDCSGWIRQEYNVPQIGITTTNNLDWDTGFQDPILTNNYIYPEVHEGWLNPVMSAPLGGFEFSQNDAVLQDTTSYSRTTIPEFSYAESNLFGTGSNDSSTTGQVVGVRPASFAAQQSQLHYVTQKCVLQSCEFRYATVQEVRNHMQTMHQDMQTCDQCLEMFENPRDLDHHAYRLGHTAFICKHENCDRRFTRRETHTRHQRDHVKDSSRFPCKYCKKYRGKNGFKRKDHLTQHIRNYHHIGEDRSCRLYDRRWCPKGDCPESRPTGVRLSSGQKAFKSSKDWINHMRTEHDESEFSCPQPGCDRVNGKGYFRGADLRTHLRKVHGTDGSFDMSIRNNLDPQ